MATVSFYSDQIANQLAKPAVLNDPGTDAGVRRKIVSETFGTDHDANEIVLLTVLPSHVILTDILWLCDGAATAGAFNLGAYTFDGNALDTVTVVDVDRFASALAITSAVTAKASILNESGTITPALAGKPLWEMIGMSAPPNPERGIALCATISTNVDAATVCHFEFQYSQDN